MIDACQTVSAMFERAVSSYRDRCFLSVLPETADVYGIRAEDISYGAADAEIAQIARIYRDAGYGLGHRVGLLLENRPSFLLHWLALNRLGVSIVPINPDLRSAELEYLIAHSELVTIVAIAERHTALHAAAVTAGRSVHVYAPGDPPASPPFMAHPEMPNRESECALLYTSGTTGRPKGCVLTNAYFLQAAHWYSTVGGLATLRPGVERMLTPLPVFHMNAIAYSAMAMICTGGCLIVLDRFHPRSWWESVRQSRATIIHYLGVMPPMLMGAAELANDQAHDVRFGFGAGVDRTLHGPFEQRFGFPLIEAWAMTETGAGAVIAATHEPRHVGTGCFGAPEPGLQVRIVLENGSEAPIGTHGELLVRRKGSRPRLGFFDSYLKDPAATDAAWRDNWFHTGDIVVQADDGSLCFVDRKKNVIRRSGENISAVEVESVLLQYPSIRQVAVAAVPDAIRGDEVFACVVVDRMPADRSGRDECAADIMAWCLARLSYHKAPGYVAFVAAVPLTTTQKIQRGQLKELVTSALAGEFCVDTRALKKRVPA